MLPLTLLTGKFKEKQGKKGKWRRKEGKLRKGRWKIENGRRKSNKIRRGPFFFFFFFFLFNGNFLPGKSISHRGKNDFAPSEKYSSYALEQEFRGGV